MVVRCHFSCYRRPAGMVALALVTGRILIYTYESSSRKGKNGFFCAVLWPWPEFDVVKSGFYLLVNGVARQYLTIGDLTSNILRHL